MLVFDACFENNMSLCLKCWCCFFFQCTLSYLIPPLFFSPSSSLSLTPSSLSQYESLYLAYLVWGLSFIYVLLLLSSPSVTLLYQHAVFRWCGEKLHFVIWNLHHITSPPSRKEERKNNVCCRRYFHCRCRLCNLTVTQMLIYPKQMLQQEL